MESKTIIKLWFTKLVVITLLLCKSISLHAEEQIFITLASTTSTENSGLLSYLIPNFKAKTGIDVRVVAVGTGRALLLGERGDADLVLVHHRASEEKFVEKGFGIERHNVMYNDFVIVGPKTDPAKIKMQTNTINALKQIYSHSFPFISRGDDSGTHKKEIELWNMAEINPQRYSGIWYREAGAGMGATLNIANAMNAYTLSDRGTWLSFQNRDELKLLLENDPPLFNQYGVILVNPERHPHIKYSEAKLFSDWLTSSEGQQAIAKFTLNGQQLFFPNANQNVALLKSKTE